MSEPEIKRGPGRPPNAAPPKAAEPCEECFPEGWKGLAKDTFSVGCLHGTYVKG